MKIIDILENHMTFRTDGDILENAGKLRGSLAYNLDMRDIFCYHNKLRIYFYTISELTYSNEDDAYFEADIVFYKSLKTPLFRRG